MIRKHVSGDKNRITKLAVSAGVIIILLLLPALGLSIYYTNILIGVFIYTIAAASLRLVNLSGQCSLGHAGFMCISAYTSALLAKNYGWTPWMTMVLGALLALAIGFLAAIPFTRLRGIYFAMISLFFAMAVVAFDSLLQDITGGASGLAGIPALFGISQIPYYYFCLGLLVICLLIMYRLEFSRIGLTWKAIAQSYTEASSIGINETGQRILCLAIGGFFAGIAGVMYAHYYQLLSTHVFEFQTSIYLFIYMMVGGVNSFAGPIIGAAILIIIPAIFRNLNEYVPFIYAAILLIVVFMMPNGLVGLPEQLTTSIKNLRKDKDSCA